MFATTALATLVLLFQAPDFQAPDAQVSNQHLIDIAPPGSIVHLRRTFDPHSQPLTELETLRIDKPLTVFGNGHMVRHIRARGPGSGDLVLHGLVVTHAHYCVSRCDPVIDWQELHRPFDGGFEIDGFDRVRVYESTADGVSVFDGRGELAFIRCDFSLAFSWHSWGRDHLPPNTQLWHTRFADGWHNSIPRTLAMTGSGQLGEPLAFDWSSFGYGILWASPGVRTPRLDLHGQYWIFLDDSPLFVKLGQRARVLIPPRRELIGVEATFQATDFGGRYSSPVWVLIHP